jgi:UDP-N-acetylmuramyl-tripeptide synthetase
MREYCNAKARLFAALEPGAVAVLNRDSAASQRMAEVIGSGVRTLWYGMGADADLRAEILDITPDGTRLLMVMPNGSVELFLRLVGRHNVENALAAAGAALALGVSELTIASALEDARPVPGRLELVESPAARHSGIRVFVDYAHTPDALAQVCDCLRETGEGRLLVVFGCGGDRDPHKRAPMAGAVGSRADALFMTSDNPRSEDPEQILDQMERGLAGTTAQCFRIADRAEAIRCAVAAAEPGDTVLIAGKGHETTQCFKGSTMPFDDRIEAARALAAREAGWLHR